MNYKEIAASAAAWAKDKIGCKYSQAQRTAANIFDCSSLVARAYSAQGKRWLYGGAVPVSCNEVYDDDFELLWPANYGDIGKSMGGASVIAKAKQPGDVQYLCTDKSTTRSNKITHVAMVLNATKIVHARGTAYGVVTNDIDLYAGKVCAVMRYNPVCMLRTGMKGLRTQELQKTLNGQGADLVGDGEFGPKTTAAVKAFQASKGLGVTGEADSKTLAALGIFATNDPEDSFTPQSPTLNHGIRVTGAKVNIRTGPGTQFDSVVVVDAGKAFEEVDMNGWIPILLDGQVRWISPKMCERI